MDLQEPKLKRGNSDITNNRWEMEAIDFIYFANRWNETVW
ncbi:UNVERIFIED_ORG: hypothetical protein QE415_002305 [Bacillus thuringiensis]|nr:hypothetical protein [Bacillus thuringiensis]